MKKILKCIGYLSIPLFILFLYSQNVNGASGGQTQYQNVTTTGTTAINFDFKSTEIFVVNYSTADVYISWTSTTCTGSSYDLLLRDTIIETHREEIRSIKMSTYSLDPVLDIGISIKGWGIQLN